MLEKFTYEIFLLGLKSRSSNANPFGTYIKIQIAFMHII